MDTVKEAKPRMGAIASDKSADKSKHYCYSVDLRSVKNLNIEHTIKCFCRYENFSFFLVLCILYLSFSRHAKYD